MKPGQYDWRYLMGPDRAQQHRPTNPEQMAAEIRRLASTGLTQRDISVALRVDMGLVLAALHGRRGAA
jgi:hypothetical protein